MSSTTMGGPEAVILGAVASAVAASDYPRAADIADRALARGMRHPNLFNARAIRHEQQGQFEAALADFRQAAALAPKNVGILNGIGLNLIRLGRLDEAVAVFGQALDLDPRHAQSHFRKGWALRQAGRLDDAKAALNAALAIDIRIAGALANLASIAIAQGQTKDARLYAEQALKLDANEATAIAALASADLSESDYKAAEGRLRGALLSGAAAQPQGRGVLQGLLGDALSGQKRFAEAFDAYAAEKEIFRHLTPRPPADAGRSLTDMVHGLIGFMQTAPEEVWSAPQEPDAAGEPSRHVFLVEFPQSGGDRIAQALKAGPGVALLSERDFLAPPADRYLTSPQGLARFAMLAPEVVKAERAAYWSQVHAAGLDAGTDTFIDHNSLHAIKLPLIARLFPRAKILFLVRDPRDAALNVFRSHFAANPATSELMTLEGTARFYDAMMGLMELSLARLPIAFVQHRYEDLAENYEAALLDICEFCGVRWQEAMARSEAPAAKDIGQWHHYRTQLAPILPILDPWAARFGYASDRS